jgi:hypothetical protein
MVDLDKGKPAMTDAKLKDLLSLECAIIAADDDLL